MGLAQVQRLLARLATDGPLRERFQAGPAEVAQEFGLTPAESANLTGLAIDQVDDFAASLIGKRRGEVESLLPLTAKAIEPPRFARLFHRHARNFLPTGIKKHRDDAVAFAALVAQEVSEPPWLADLARLEATSLIAYDPARRWTLIRLRHHPFDLARAALEGEHPRSRPTLVLWFRPGKQAALKRVFLSWPWWALMIRAGRPDDCSRPGRAVR